MFYWIEIAEDMVTLRRQKDDEDWTTIISARNVHPDAGSGTTLEAVRSYLKILLNPVDRL